MSYADIKIEIDEDRLRELVVEYLSGILNVDLKPEDVVIEVKSVRDRGDGTSSIWQTANFRARVARRID